MYRDPSFVNHRFGSAQWVVGHGLWQLSHGRVPTQQWRGVSVPEDAFKKALEALMYPSFGSDIEGHLREMIRVAKAARKPVQSKFDGVLLMASPGDRLEFLLGRFESVIEFAARAYWRMAEGIELSNETILATLPPDTSPFPIFSFSSERDWDGEIFWQMKLADSQQDAAEMQALRFAARWANLMETAIADGARLEDIGNETCLQAAMGGLDWVYFSWAVFRIASAWVHGTEFAAWRNSLLRPDVEAIRRADPVLNPPITVIDN